MLKVNDRVRVKELQDKEFNEEDMFEGQMATVSDIHDYIYPFELKFDDEQVQEAYEYIGKRLFLEFELEPMN